MIFFILGAKINIPVIEIPIFYCYAVYCVLLCPTLFFCILHLLLKRTIMSVLKEFTLEYGFKTSPKLLYTAISSPEGLSRWFADIVEADDDIYSFKWEGSEQKARLVSSKENEFVQFMWLDNADRDECIQMRIQNEPVSSELALIITDYAEETDLDFSKRIWDAQVKKLQRLLNI